MNSPRRLRGSTKSSPDRLHPRAQPLALAILLSALVAAGVPGHLPGSASAGALSLPARPTSPGPASLYGPAMAPCPALPATAPGCAVAPNVPVPLAAGRTWINATPNIGVQPPAILWDSLTFDPVDGYALLFGGCNTTTCPVPAQTWSYSNASWQNLTAGSAQPPSRSYAMMAFDGTDNYAVLFGGASATASFNDTWTYVGGVWTNRTATVGAAPSPRWGASLAYDSSDGYLVLFGGLNDAGVALSDTWTFDHGQWRNITGGSGSPPARFESSMAWDANDQQVVLVDGCGRAVCPLNDTWGFQNGQWSNLSGQAAPLPPARNLAMLSYDQSLQSALLFGGYVGTAVRSDTWSFQNNRWTDLTASLTAAPPARGSGAVMEDTAGYTTSGVRSVPYVLLFGGDHVLCPTCGPTGIPDTWVFESPPTVSASSSPTSPEAGVAVAFSGSSSGGTAPVVLSWDFGDGSVGTGATPLHAYASPGNYSAQLTGVDAAGAAAQATRFVDVIPGPGASASASVPATDVGVPVTFTATPEGGTPPYSLAWTLSDGATSNLSSLSHAFATAGVAVASLIVRDSVGGVGRANVQVVVAPPPIVTLTVGESALTTGQSTTFTATVQNGTGPFNYSWQLGDGSVLYGAIVSHAYASPGGFAVSVTVTDVVGASAQNATVVQVTTSSPNPTTTPPASAFPWGWLALVVVAVAVIAAAVVVLRRRGRSPPAAPPPISPPPAPPAASAAPPAPPPAAWDEGV